MLLRTLKASSSTLFKSSASSSIVSKRFYSSETPESFEHGVSFGLSEDQLSFQQLARDFTVSYFISLRALKVCE